MNDLSNGSSEELTLDMAKAAASSLMALLVEARFRNAELENLLRAHGIAVPERASGGHTGA